MKQVKLALLSILFALAFTAGALHSQPADEFELYSEEGKVSLSDFRGTVVMLYFGYTSCPDICPTSLARISTAYRSLSKDQQAKIQPILISLDPDRDSKSKLKSYVEHFLPNMIGLTGSKEQVAEVAKNYNISFRKTEVESGLGYVIDHSSIYFIIGKDGQLFTHLLHNVDPPEIAAALKAALQIPKLKS